MILQKTETALRAALQKTVTFEVNGKVLREGRFILYNIKDFYITFNLITSKQLQKTYELPLPFEVVQHEDYIIFDYTFKNITRDDKYSCQ